MKKLYTFFKLISYIFILSFTLQAQHISGTVLSRSTNNPIIGALVSLHGSTNQVVSASDGRFILPATGSNLRIVGAAKGYYYQSVSVDSPTTGLTLYLDPVPVSDNAAYQVRPPQECGSCHPK